MLSRTPSIRTNSSGPTSLTGDRSGLHADRRVIAKNGRRRIRVRRETPRRAGLEPIVRRRCRLGLREHLDE